MKYYIVNLSHYCSFKCAFDNGEDVNKLAVEYVKQQNRGEAKSDRIFLHGVTCVTKQQYLESLLFDYTKLIKL